MAMPPSSNDVDAMARIMQAMNGTGPSLNKADALTPQVLQGGNTGYVPPGVTVAAGDHIDPTNDMQRLIMAMNEGVYLEDQPKAVEPTFESKVRETHVDPSSNDMQNILNLFKGADEPVSRMNERSVSDKQLREAMVTETTANGVRVGSWEIRIRDIGGLKSYTVSNIHTNEPIASDLTLYDAAKGIASALNEGLTINTPTVRKLLNAEGSYSRARQSAAEFRQSMTLAEGRGDRTKKAIAEDRFNEALARAKEARTLLSKLVE